MLFSEPKIPQLNVALDIQQTPAYAFQCSSASRKFLNSPKAAKVLAALAGFSALQRAENSSMDRRPARVFQSRRFSALQRAENSSMVWQRGGLFVPLRFSALQRAENSSIVDPVAGVFAFLARFSALQRAENSSIPTLAPASIHISDRDDHASSFLSLPGASP